MFYAMWLVKQAVSSGSRPKVTSNKVHWAIFAGLTVILTVICVVFVSAIYKSDTYLGVAGLAALACLFLVIAEKRVGSEIDQETDLTDEVR